MSSVAGVKPAVRPTVCFPFVRVEVSDNDPKFNARLVDTNRIRLSGTATNSGTKPSSLGVTVDGRRVNVHLSRGMTPAAAFKALQDALPPGYKATQASAEKRPGGDVVVEISRPRKPVPTADVSKIPTSITGNGADASVDAKLWVNLMPGRGLSRAPIGKITIHGVGFNDAPPKFKVQSLKVFDQKTHRLVATIDKPNLQDSEVRRGEKRQDYRIELPTGLDPKGKYTIVANVSINGSKAADVRSSFVPIDRVY